MVIGNGLMAKRFSSYQNDRDIIIFASGVSDSKTTSLMEFNRERNLLTKTIENNRNKRLVYFSTCSVKDESVSGSDYVVHKLSMEKLIEKEAGRYIVFRLSNIVGVGGNNKTVFNYLYNQIAQEKHFTLWANSYRNILDIDDLFLIVDYIIKNKNANKTWNVAAPKSHAALDLVVAIEQFLNKKAKYDIVEKGSSYEIDIEPIEQMISSLEISFDNSYISRILKKYYSNEI